MAHKNKNKNRTANSQNQPSGILEKFDDFFGKRSKLFLIIALSIYVLFALLLFDKLVSLGGDDSSYIVRAHKFVKEFTFPSYQGPLYPLTLGLFVLVFGVNIVVLKSVSFISLGLFLYFFYKVYLKKLPSGILFSALLFFSLNASLLYFASQTYNEAFYLFVQSLFLLVFINKFINPQTFENDWIKGWKPFLFLGLSILALGLTRSIAYSALVAVLGYFVLYGRWQAVVKTMFSFLMSYGVYSLIKKIIWGRANADFSSQGTGLLYKNYYNHAEGKEDLAGFFQRFIDNSHLYLSKHFMVFSSLRDSVPGMKIMPFVTVLVYILVIIALIQTYKKNKYVFFTGIFAGTYAVASFFALQKNWDQERLIIPIAPLLFTVVISGFYYFLKNPKYKSLQFLFPLLVIFLIASSFKNISEKAKERSELKGPWYGLTTDWINYIKCSQWAAENIPEESKLASRKPSISFIYSKGREFVGVYSFKTMNTTEVLSGIEDSVFVMAGFNEVFGQKLAPNVQNYLRFNISYIVNTQGGVYGLFELENQQKDAVYDVLNGSGIEYTVSPKNYLANSEIDFKQGYTVSPDSLLGFFQKRDVEYVVKGSLRVNPYQKTDRTINTIHRYLIFIEQKYPGIFEVVNQFGETNDEPAVLYKIRYDKYGLSK